MRFMWMNCSMFLWWFSWRRARVRSCSCQLRCGFNKWLLQKTENWLAWPTIASELCFRVSKAPLRNSVCAADWRPFLYPEVFLVHPFISISIHLLDDDRRLNCVLFPKETSELMLRIWVFTVKSPALLKEHLWAIISSSEEEIHVFTTEAEVFQRSKLVLPCLQSISGVCFASGVGSWVSRDGQTDVHRCPITVRNNLRNYSSLRTMTPK